MRLYLLLYFHWIVFNTVTQPERKQWCLTAMPGTVVAVLVHVKVYTCKGYQPPSAGLFMTMCQCNMSSRQHHLTLVHCPSALWGKAGRNDVTPGGLCALSPGPKIFECEYKGSISCGVLRAGRKKRPFTKMKCRFQLKDSAALKEKPQQK